MRKVGLISKRSWQQFLRNSSDPDLDWQYVLGSHRFARTGCLLELCVMLEQAKRSLRGGVDGNGIYFEAVLGNVTLEVYK
ncbi:hypothetical protein TNIN_363111 [Trichonephila inaurata madagascariensis]|uniref:Uncharacterized protein n=1 Tax=Trichonephila inaurata madagascariensis TaxID=2747483 RepID=A0A8X6X9F6_9ARAC|nr:hypothetical protein TNIN_363111 [Trichonephila inaurata madagascariensis]